MITVSQGYAIRYHTESKTLAGYLTEMYPVTLDNGRTIIYISDKNKEGEIRSMILLHQCWQG
jgi:hypothetical protein